MAGYSTSILVTSLETSRRSSESSESELRLCSLQVRQPKQNQSAKQQAPKKKKKKKKKTKKKKYKQQQKAKKKKKKSKQTKNLRVHVGTDFAFVMGGKDTEGFMKFVDLCCNAYNVLRKHATLFINLFAMVRELPQNQPKPTYPNSDSQYR